MTVDSSNVVTALLASLVQGRPMSAETWAATCPGAFWNLAAQHGVTPLVAEHLCQDETAPPAWRGRALAIIQSQIATDLAHESEMRRWLGALDGAGVAPLLIKGAMLAHSHYPRPDLRPRLDADIVIAPEARRLVHDTFLELGYEADVHASAGVVLHQRTYVKRLSGSLTHAVDVHWRLANPEVFRSVLSFDEMDAEATRIVKLSPAARGLSDVHALLVACVHRVAHHVDQDRLIWLYDIHLLASCLDAHQWRRLTALAIDRRLTAVCSAGLRRTVDHFDTRVPAFVWARLSPADQASEVTAEYLRPNRRRVTAVMEDLKALPTWNHRWRLVCDYAFPPAAYMREVYAPASTRPLSWLYARRMLFGARKWLQPG